MNLYTDASGSEGWGAFWSGRWLQSHWLPAQLVKPILWKELFTIVNAVNTWGHQWAKQKILFHCDNEAVVEIWCKGSTRDSETMALVRLLYFCAARYDINVVITHISGIDNLYLAGLCLAHLELGHSDPTVDESLRLVIRGIRCL